MPLQTDDHRLFLESPFSNVASERTARCWAGRSRVLDSLLRLKRALARMSDSTLDVMWANLGAGKTHTLLHLAYLLQQDSEAHERTICAFVEMPEQVRNFLDVYKRIIPALPLDHVAEYVGSCPSGKIMDSVCRAANVINHGGPGEKEIVREWIAGGRPLLRDLRQVSGINQRIEDDLAATDVFSSIVHAFSLNRSRLLILVDEFQRIGVLKPTAQNKVLSCIRSVFSRSPSYFSMLLSIQSLVEQSALAFIPPELATLLGKKPTISLPEMNEAEAREFLIGRFQFFRPPGYAGESTAPFKGDTVDAVLSFIHEDAGVIISPREIIQAFAYVYGQAEDLDKGIGAEEALKLLREVYGKSQGQ